MFIRLKALSAPVFGLIAATGASAAVLAADDGGKALVEEKCADCHGLAPAASNSLEDRLERKGPPLFYAGDKFREGWLAQWLQDPVRIRPAGDYYGHHVKPGPKGDVIDEATLPTHPALDEKSALAAAGYLMSLTAKSDVLAAIDYEPKAVSKRMGMLNFGKFKGCASCHSDEPGYGGVSGPELYTAFQRLNPDYIVSYIMNPRVWEPNSLMPNQHLGKDDAEKLANYLMVVSEGRK